MRPLRRTLALGLLASTLAACSSSDDGTAGAEPLDEPTNGAPVAGSDGADTTPDAGPDGTDATPDAGPDGADATPDAGPDGTDATPDIVVGGESDSLQGASVTFSGTDRNSCDDRVLGIYVRSLAEVCSLGGPSTYDGNRGDDAPSAPTGLTALLVSSDWIQIDWVPSADDGEIVAYEIYRDGLLAGTVSDDETLRTSARNYWRTTTYIDCDYTRFLCDEEGGIGRPRAGEDHTYAVVAIDDTGNRSDASAPLTVRSAPAPGGTSAPDPASEGYRQTFADEFDGDRLDREKWVTSLSFDTVRDDGTSVNGEQQYFVDTRGQDVGFPYDPFVFEDGKLRITAARTADVLAADRIAEAEGQPYLSGVISSRSKFDGVEYGYVEMSAKVPSGTGLLSTFFLFQPVGNQYEIDILEYLGRKPNGATQNYHYRDGFRFADTGFQGVPHASPTMTIDEGVDLSGAFHTYSVLWEPELVIWYVDGREVRRLTGPRVSDVSMDIVAQLVVGSPNFAGDPSGVRFPVSYDIDYIRVWQQ